MNEGWNGKKKKKSSTRPAVFGVCLLCNHVLHWTYTAILQFSVALDFYTAHFSAISNQMSAIFLNGKKKMKQKSVRNWIHDLLIVWRELNHCAATAANVSIVGNNARISWSWLPWYSCMYAHRTLIARTLSSTTWVCSWRLVSASNVSSVVCFHFSSVEVQLNDGKDSEPHNTSS